MKVEAYSISGPINGICKQYAVWGEAGSYMAPLIYLQRPKWIVNDAQWLAIVNSVRISSPTDLEMGGL